MNEDILNINLQRKFPIPGTSLTTDPDNPFPHDRPPEFTNLHKALNYIFENIIEEENYSQFIKLMADGFPLMEVAQTMLFSGFYEGKWNFSLMQLLIEPTAYILLALCERADIDPTFFRDDIEDDLDEEEVFGTSFAEVKGRQIQKDLEQTKKGLPSIDKEMQAKLDAIPQEQIESLLSGQTEEESGSLLANQQGE
ncbi:MAG: hypothetical protein CL833_02060 [Crocinitomicaceae bacterium]|nr:hypothetical protein [Crocinitomicaceae bacterium]|tara:strand:- start:1886 stop:2473 length:588 start_codon:yes stop_codon:yes gene_type:complete